MSIYFIIPFLSSTFSLIHHSPNYTVETFPDSLVRPGAEYLSQHLQRIHYATNCLVWKRIDLMVIVQLLIRMISIAVMKSIAINNDTMNSERLIDSLQIFAENLRRRQQRGQCADDALIVAIADWNFVYTSLGEVIERVLTSNVITKISQEAEPLLASANYLYGLTFMVDGYKQFLQYPPQNFEIKSWRIISASIISNWLNIFLSLIVLISFVILVILIVVRFCCNEKQQYIMGRQITR